MVTPRSADTADPAAVIRVPKQARSRRTAESLLAAAERQVASDGYAAATVRAIAQDAGVPVGSLYQYFGTKQGLLDAVVADLAASIDAIFDAMLDSRRSSQRPALDDAVRLVVAELVALAVKRPAFRSLFSGPSVAGDETDAGDTLRGVVRDHVAAILESFGADAAARAAMVCTEVVRGLLARVISPSGAIDRDLEGELVVVLSEYLAAVKRR